MNLKEQSTPTLVRLYRDLYVKGSQERLSNGDYYQIEQVINELRSRNVLD